MSLRRLIRPSPSALRAATAVLLLGVSLGDVALDADCDPLPLNTGELTVSLAADDDADPCANGCIPDCFCCSRTLGAQDRVLPPAPQGGVAAIAITAPGIPPGVSRPTEHPPRARA